MKKMMYTWLVLLCAAFFMVNCTEVPPVGDNPDQKPDMGTSAPADLSKGPSGELKRSWQVLLPRSMDALYVMGDTAFACTREDSLYKNDPTKATYLLTVLDTHQGEVKWSLSNTMCSFKVSGERMFVLRNERKEGSLSMLDVDMASGKVERVISVAHAGCTNVYLSGAGEQMFADQPFKSTFPCFSMGVEGSHILFRNDQSVQLFDVQSGKVIWSESAEGKVGRIAGATVAGDMVYMVVATEELAQGNVDTKLNVQTAHAPKWKYQLRALNWRTNEAKWSAGPLPAPVLDASLAVSEGSVFVQTMTAFIKTPEDIKKTRSHYEGLGWSGQINTYGFHASSGELKWSFDKSANFAKQTDGLAPLLSDMKTQGELLFFHTFSDSNGLRLHAVRQADGTKEVWGTMVKRGSEYKTTTPTDGILEYKPLPVRLQMLSLNKSMLVVREDIGTSRLVRVSDDMKFSTFPGLLQQHAPVGMAAASSTTTKPDAPKKPKHVVETSPYCNRLDGSSVAMSSIRSETRFFLPPGRSYYGPNQFFNAFCSDYHLQVNAYDADKLMTSGSKRALWATKLYVAEAPVFAFMRNGKLHVLSDNGDWYGFTMKQ